MNATSGENWDCPDCGRHMTPHGDCPSCAKKEKARAIAAGEIKRARDIKVGDVISPRFSFKNNFNTVETVEVTPKGKVVVNRGKGHFCGEDVFQPEQWVDVAKPKRASNCSDDCEQNHCPKCGGHTLGWLDTYQKCQSCELEEEHHNSTNFYCEVHPDENVVRIFRGPKNMIGFVGHNNEKGDYLSVRGDEVNGVTHLTLNEIEIIMDNWNQCQELRREKVHA